MLKRLGIGGLAADSINGLFFRNCISYGLPALSCRGVRETFEEGDIASMDLLRGTVVNERTQRALQGTPLAAAMVDTLRAGGIEELLRRQGFLRGRSLPTVEGGRAC